MSDPKEGPESVASPVNGSALSRGELQRRAMSGSLWTATHTVLAVPLAFLANAVVARVLGPASYGDLALLTLLLALLTQATHLSFSDGVIQWGAAAESRGDHETARSLLRRSLGYHVLVQLPLLVAAVLYLGRDQSWWIRGALLLSVLMPVVFSSSALSLTISNRTADAVKVAIVSNVVVQGSIAVVAVLNGTAAGVWATRSVAASILLPLNLLLLDRMRRRESFRLSLPIGMPSGFWRFCSYSWLAGLVGTLVFSRSEVVLLSWLTTPEAVGLFALAYGLSTQITAPVDAVTGPLIPAVTSLLSSHAGSVAAALMRSVRFAALLAGAVTAAVLPLFFAAIPLIYGADFAPAAPLFLVLGAASCFQSICNPVVVFTRARRRTDVVFGISTFALVVNVGIALALIPVLGLWGATLANVAGLTAFFVVALRHELPVHDISLAMLLRASGSWFVALAAAAVAVLLAWTVPWPVPVAALAAAVLGSGIFLLGLRLTNTGLTGPDIEAVGRALPRSIARPALLALAVVEQRRP